MHATFSVEYECDVSYNYMRLLIAAFLLIRYQDLLLCFCRRTE